MIEQYFVQPAVLRRLRSGLMAPYLDSLPTELEALHYSHKSIRRQPRNVDAFGRWLINQKIPLNEVTDAVVNRYVKPMHRSPSPGRARGYRPHNGRGLARLLELLRRRSVVPLEKHPCRRGRTQRADSGRFRPASGTSRRDCSKHSRGACPISPPCCASSCLSTATCSPGSISRSSLRRCSPPPSSSLLSRPATWTAECQPQPTTNAGEPENAPIFFTPVPRFRPIWTAVGQTIGRDGTDTIEYKVKMEYRYTNANDSAKSRTVYFSIHRLKGDIRAGIFDRQFVMYNDDRSSLLNPSPGRDFEDVPCREVSRRRQIS